jgi:hypothetical protein
MEIKMKKIFVQIEILSFLIFMGTTLASSSYRDYRGTGDFYVNSTLKNVEEHATGSADAYSGSQYITDDKTECQGYDICSADVSNINNGNVDLEQTITDNYNGESSITTYNTGLSGTGTAYSALFSSSNGGYGYQYSSATGDTYAYFTQNHKENGNFDYEASYGGGTLGCDNGNTVMQNNYQLMNSPTYYSPIELTPNCTGEGCTFVYLQGNATDLLDLNMVLSTQSMSWNNMVHNNGPIFYGMYTVSDQPINFNFGMVLG